MNATVLMMKSEQPTDHCYAQAMPYSARKRKWVHRVLLVSTLTLSALGTGNAIAAQQITVGSDVFTGVGFVVRTAVDAGGGDLLTVNGNNGDSASLTGGTGTSFEVGARLDLRLFERPAFETELTLGLKRATLESGSNATEFTYTTLAVSQYYRFKSGVRLGAGIGLCVSPTLDVNVRGFQNTSTSLDSAPELSLMMEYGFSRGIAIGARVLQATWESDGESVDGSSAGVYLAWQTR